MRAVNLLPRELERQSDGAGGRAPLFVAAGGFAAVTAAAVVLFLSASGTVSDQRVELESLEAAIAAVANPRDAAAAPAAIAQERADRVAALSAALTTRAPLDRLLRDLSYVLPQDAWLTGLSASAPETAEVGATQPGPSAQSPAGVESVTIQGATYSHSSVARVLARLNAIPSLDEVRLAAAASVRPAAATADAKNTKKEKKQKAIVAFTIAANIRVGSGS